MGKKHPKVKYRGSVWTKSISTGTKAKAKEHAKRWRKQGYNCRIVETKKIGGEVFGMKYSVLTKKRKWKHKRRR